MKFIRTIVAAGGIAASTFAFAAEKITGAGATFPYPIYSKWADAFKKESGNEVNYQSIGSGGGIQQIRSNNVTFGASDMPLEPAELDRDGLIPGRW
jgi:phosphate transport system substrate-binding protein